MREIGKLERVEIREVWSAETEFTRWLAEHADYITEVTGAAIPDELLAEQSTANFRVDLVGQTDDGDYVVVENQFGYSDHDHLGKLITYAASSKAKTAVWIVESARAEHIDAVNMLNQVPGTSFYMLALEVVQIGNSLPAPKLTLIVGPSEDARDIGATKRETKRELAERHVLRKQFWTELLRKCPRDGVPSFAGRTPGTDTWIGASAGRGGLMFSYVIRMHDSQVELYIDVADSDEGNKAVLDYFRVHEDEIHKAFGGRLEWQELPGKRACRIAKRYASGGLLDRENWSKIQDEMIEGMARLAGALRPFIKKMQV